MAPGVGIEPTIAESKSVVLPLHYPGIKLVACTRIELVSVDYQSTALAIELTGKNLCWVGAPATIVLILSHAPCLVVIVGVEPTLGTV